jgi:hypothetical protein
VIQKAIADLAEAKPRFRLTAFRQLMNFPTTWNDLEIWQFADPDKAAAARLQIMKALRIGDVLEGILLKEQPKVQVHAQKYRGFTLHNASLTWDLEKLVSRQIGPEKEGTPKEVTEKMVAVMKKIMGEGKEVWFGSNKKVYVQVSGPDWASARRKLDQYLDRTKTLASQPDFQDTRKRLPAQATVVHFIEMATYGQLMAEFMQSLVPKSEKIPPADTSKTGYFGTAITFEPGRGKLDVWLPAAGIRAFYLPVEILTKAMELEPAVPEPPRPPKKEIRPKFDLYPRGLAFLRKAADNMPLKRKMACKLVDHIRCDAEDTPSLLRVVARLEQELSSKAFRDWCAQLWVEEPVHP